MFSSCSTLFGEEVYYIDAVSGSDAANGLTPVTAWQTLDKVSTSSFSKGDAIVFRSGQTFADSFKISQDSLWFTKYDSATGIIGALAAGGNPIITGSDTMEVLINVADHINITITDIKFDSALTHVDSLGKFGRIARCEFRNDSVWALKVTGDSSFIDHNLFVANRGSGLYLKGLDCLVANNYFDSTWVNGDEEISNGYAIQFDTSGFYYNNVVQNSFAENSFYVFSSQQVLAAANIFDQAADEAPTGVGNYAEQGTGKYATTFSKTLVGGRIDTFQRDRGINIQETAIYQALDTKIVIGNDFYTYDVLRNLVTQGAK